MPNFSQDDTNLSVWFTIDNQEYQLAQFNISFNQMIDHKGEPQNMVRGGKMHLMFKHTLPESIYSWALNPGIKKNGKVEFRTESTSSPFKVEFINAYCINFDREVDSVGGGLSSGLILSPDEMTINGISFDNRWTN